MKTLIIGASGATGKQLVAQLVKSGQKVQVIVRPTSQIPTDWQNNESITIIKQELSTISSDEMVNYLADCQAVASCLGHTLSWKGIYGKPRKLVTDAVRLVGEAIEKTEPEKPVKFVLMNTAGNRNRDLKEPISVAQKMVVGLIRLLLPPHTDNEAAADYLRLHIGQKNPRVEWVVVRPDTLINEEAVSEYTLHPSPTSSAIFKPGKTSRINVGHFMAQLITNDNLWEQWKGQMPVIYNEVK